MSWGLELWDQFENISGHTQKGIDFCEKLCHFFKERCSIENDYAGKLKKLVKSYLPKVDKGEKKKEQEFTCMKGFQGMVKELADRAGQHEVIAESLNTNVLKELQSTIAELKQERKRLLAEGARQQGALQNQLSQLDKAKKQYEKSFREAEKAIEAYNKAEQDIHLSKADLEKSKQTMTLKQQSSDDSKAEYAVEVQKTNRHQGEHYEQLMPNVFQQLQDLDEKRTTKIKSLISTTANIERQVTPIITKCIDGVEQASTIIDCKQDSQIVIDQFKTGFVPPSDVQFEDLSNGVSSCPPVTSAVVSSTAKGTVSGGKGKKRSGILGIFGGAKNEETREDYSHLPPNQQRKRLAVKIETLQGALSKETSERDALLKMQDVYRQNAQLGDPATVDRQLEENAQKLDQLRQEIAKYENYLADVDKGGATELGHTPTPSPLQTRHTAAEPAAQVDNQQRNTVYGREDSFEDEFNDLGTCVALYAFEATTDGALSMTEGEQFVIIEADQGDGWTFVRRTNGQSGFVPTSYVQCQFTN